MCLKILLCPKCKYEKIGKDEFCDCNVNYTFYEPGKRTQIIRHVICSRCKPQQDQRKNPNTN
jgi:hypothetical protein